MFENSDEMQKAIDDYFENQCETEFYTDSGGEIIITKNGPLIKNLNAPSLAGLALHLGYASRQSIYDNEKSDKFSYVIKKARTKVEQWIYQHSLDGSVPPAVGIFILKQFGYTDKHEVKLENITIGKPPSLDDVEFPE